MVLIELLEKYNLSQINQVISKTFSFKLTINVKINDLLVRSLVHRLSRENKIVKVILRERFKVKWKKNWTKNQREGFLKIIYRIENLFMIDEYHETERFIIQKCDRVQIKEKLERKCYWHKLKEVIARGSILRCILINF